MGRTITWWNSHQCCSVKNSWTQSAGLWQVTAGRLESSVQVVEGRRLFASCPTTHPRQVFYGTTVCNPLYFEYCSSCKYLFQTCPCKEACRVFRIALNSGRHLENVSVIWVLQLREVVNQWLNSRASHPVIAAALVLFGHDLLLVLCTCGFLPSLICILFYINSSYFAFTVSHPS